MYFVIVRFWWCVVGVDGVVIWRFDTYVFFLRSIDPFRTLVVWFVSIFPCVLLLVGG